MWILQWRKKLIKGYKSNSGISSGQPNYNAILIKAKSMTGIKFKHGDFNQGEINDCYKI